MAKQLLSQRYIYKIPSQYLEDNGWDIELDIQKARKAEMLVTLASSEVIRFIDDIVDSGFSEKKVKKLKSSIKQAKNKKSTIKPKREISNLYKELNNMLLVEDYVVVVMNNDKQYDRAVEGFKINGNIYKRLLSTSGGVKNSAIIFTREDIKDELLERINCGRDMSKEFVPGKLGSYMGLACSASTPVSNPCKVLVVHDCETEFTSTVVEVDDTKTEYPTVELKDNYQIKLNASDGFGLVTYEMAEQWSKDLHLDYIPSGFTIRNAYCKGMMFAFPFKEFAEEVAKEYIVKDAWGHERDIREIDMILTTSMLKLWDSYGSWEDYENNYKKYGYSFSVTKTTPKETDEERHLNYQFIQSLKLTDEMIDELIKPTVDEIKDIIGLDYRKTIIYATGENVTDDSASLDGHGYIQSIMIDKRMLHNKYVRQQIRSMIRKRSNDAKKGKLKVRGNFQTLSGDPYALMQSIFELEVTGLLKAGEIYSKHWINRGVNKVAGFRAPMTCANNIVLMNIVSNDDVSKWYRHMNTVTILNSWDTTCASLNGADFDGDSVFTTDNKVIIDGIDPQPAIFCVQKAAKKKLCNESDFIKADKLSFGNEIGSITNRITAMFDVLAKFEEESLEYKTVMYRIMTGQNYQQNSIDKSKGIVSKTLPKEWYSASKNKIKEDDSLDEIKEKEFNLSILADKKPYFFIYNYPHLRKELKEVERGYNEQSIFEFGLTMDQMLDVESPTRRQQEIIDNYKRDYPVYQSSSVMNRICWKLEEDLDLILSRRFKVEEFDYNIMKSDYKVKKEHKDSILKLYKEYHDEVIYEKKIKCDKVNRSDSDKTLTSQKYIYYFKEQAESICPNQFELCNIMIELVEENKISNQFMWSICEDTIIKNLLKNNNNTFKYMVQDESGEVEYGGKNFTLKEKVI